jgi:dephospho-CoA kinase
VVAEFGDDILTADGALDRDALAARVFGDDAARARLNAIVHPLVGARSTQLISEAAAADPLAVIVNDVPLMVEAKVADRYEVVVVVAAEPQTQLSRLLEQRGMSEADARARIAAQAPLADKLAIADYVIRNDSDLDTLQSQVEQVWSALAARAGRTMRA